MTISPFLRRWAVWLLGVFVLAIYVNAAPSLVSGGCNNCLLRTGDTATGTLSSSVASGTNAFGVLTNGARIDFGAGLLDYASSDGTRVTFASSQFAVSGYIYSDSASAQGLQCANSGAQCLMGALTGDAVTSPTVAAMEFQLGVNLTDGDLAYAFRNNSAYVATIDEQGYIASTTPHTMFVTYVNNTIAAFTYGGGVAPAHDFEVSAVRFSIRTAGSGGSSNATIRISDGTSNCDCSFACNTAAGNQRIACGTDANCDFEASDSMTVSVSSVGDCTVTTDILGNIEFETLWEYSGQ